MTNFFSKGNSGDNEGFTSSENLFTSNNSAKKQDNSLNGQYNDLKLNYEQIFIEAAESIRKDLDALKPENACDGCAIKNCSIKKKDAFAPYPASGCKLREWQMQAITYLTGDYKQKLKATYKHIMDKKNECECNQCADCCRLAVSEYSYDQLKQRAGKGDKFAADFVSVFVPYQTEEEAKAANPEYFELLNKLVEEDKIYYYYCPKLEGNLCSIYENRPNICKDYPHNPLKLLPSRCSFNEWKNSVSHQAMLLKAKVDIIAFYKQKLS